MLKFDFSRVFKENVNGGLEREEIEKIEDEIEIAVKELKEKTPGFLRIINNIDVIGQVKELEEWLITFENFVVLGIGGSALGNIALHNALRPLNWNYLDRESRGGYLRVFVVDNSDPELLAAVLDQVDLSKTVFNVISKSGSTAEPMSAYLAVRNALESLGLDPKEHFVFTTDPEKGVLRQIAKEEKIKVLDIPPDVGGRFSVLTQVGLLSAMAEGIDIDELHRGAEEAKKECLKGLWENPAALIAAIHYLFFRKGRNISVMMPYSNRLYYLADWYRQLWAESLGKRYDLNGNEVKTGQTPVKALGATDQHSQLQLYNEGPDDKVITFIALDSYPRDLRIGKIHEGKEALSYLGGKYMSDLIKAEYMGTMEALTKNGKPNMSIIMDKINEFNIGAFFVTYECATAIMGALLKINPYDQPGVELGKKITYALMGRKGYEEFGKMERKEKETTLKIG